MRSAYDSVISRSDDRRTGVLRRCRTPLRRAPFVRAGSRPSSPSRASVRSGLCEQEGPPPGFSSARPLIHRRARCHEPAGCVLGSNEAATRQDRAAAALPTRPASCAWSPAHSKAPPRGTRRAVRTASSRGRRRRASHAASPITASQPAHAAAAPLRQSGGGAVGHLRLIGGLRRHRLPIEMDTLPRGRPLRSFARRDEEPELPAPLEP
jgi:hypothetical protein